MSPEIIEILSAICPRRDYAAGDILRYQGGFARDMVLVLEGEVEIFGEVISKRDAIAIVDLDSFSIKAKKSSELLIMEVPMK